MRVEYEICSTICGTTVQAILDHLSWPSWQGGVREGQNLPQIGLSLALEPSRGSQMGQWSPKWTQNNLPNSPWLIWGIFLTFWSITALTNYLNMWKLACNGILTLITSTNRTGPFNYDLIIFLRVPHFGWLGKINKPWKKCINWLVEVINVTCTFFFYRILVKKFWNLLKPQKIILMAQKNLRSSKNYL